MNQDRLARAVFKATGRRPTESRPLSGGCVGDVRRVILDDGGSIVAKLGDVGAGLEVEGYMLDLLAPHLPVPDVLLAEPDLLLMSYIEAGDSLNARSQEHAAELLASLHTVSAESFGLQRSTLIGGLPQPNSPGSSWLAFFRDHRLLYMARRAVAENRLSPAQLARIERLAQRLDQWIEEPEQPSLLHGDMWTGNVLCKGDRIAGFVDPAVYYGDPEIELAFSTLFGTFGAPFFRRYGEIRPIRSGFFETRCDLYNLYPLLVHVRLFGGSYVNSVARTLSKFGC